MGWWVSSANRTDDEPKPRATQITKVPPPNNVLNAIHACADDHRELALPVNLGRPGRQNDRVDRRGIWNVASVAEDAALGIGALALVRRQRVGRLRDVRGD
jgi:hypothetical protein